MRVADECLKVVGSGYRLSNVRPIFMTFGKIFAPSLPGRFPDPSRHDTPAPVHDIDWGPTVLLDAHLVVSWTNAF
jgi:hypothetical protein